MTPETVARIEALRQKMTANTISTEELQEALRLMREDRRAASAEPASKRSAKPKAQIKSADEMLDELGGI